MWCQGQPSHTPPPRTKLSESQCHFLILLQHKPRPALKSRYCCPHTPCSSPTPVCGPAENRANCPWHQARPAGPTEVQRHQSLLHLLASGAKRIHTQGQNVKTNLDLWYMNTPKYTTYLKH